MPRSRLHLTGQRLCDHLTTFAVVIILFCLGCASKLSESFRLRFTSTLRQDFGVSSVERSGGKDPPPRPFPQRGGGEYPLLSGREGDGRSPMGEGFYYLCQLCVRSLTYPLPHRLLMLTDWSHFLLRNTIIVGFILLLVVSFWLILKSFMGDKLRCLLNVNKNRFSLPKTQATWHSAKVKIDPCYFFLVYIISRLY